MTTIFEKIIEGDLPAEKVYESESLIAIKDINPAAPVHLLIISKKRIADLQSMTEEERQLLPEIIEVAQNLAKEYGVTDNYRLLSNIGSDAGQTIFHLHFHLIGGRRLGPMA
ncbi:HIT-like protein CPn_0488/CP_0266/CPj0488/CpB0508 [Chlamydiales bacterium SCGC AG-110-M15]|nr:HIT-like protein CPn_0488/CP_0266/CPj0488/CpB0508 [Chlamydiales bacterium SCGC AG-110-M15]